MNRKQRREAERQSAEATRAAEIKRRRGAEFTRRMALAREARLAQRLFLERGVKLVSLPTAEGKELVQKWQEQQAKRLAQLQKRAA